MNIPKVMNEWMRQYIEEPESFRRDWETILEFKREESEGREPSYGEVCHAYMLKLAEAIGS